MKTQYITIQSADFSELDAPAEMLRQGGLVAFPTETVYGLGANALDERAVQTIFKAKGRPDDNPLIVHISDQSMLNGLVAGVNEKAEKLMSAFWPGPLTMVFEKTAQVPYITTAGLNTVAVRMPAHPIALALIRRSGVPVAAPSANRSGKPSPTLAEHVVEDLNGYVAYIIDGGACQVGVESTVLDMTCDPPAILRPGGITLEMIEQIVGTVRMDQGSRGEISSGTPRSPGMKYIHYAPRGNVFVVSGWEEDVVEWIGQQINRDGENGIDSIVISAEEHLERYTGKHRVSYGSLEKPEEIAANIFRLFRECDHMGAEKIYVEAVSKEGIGYAVMDRVERAAGGKIVYV